jgi:hypothetical protein
MTQPSTPGSVPCEPVRANEAPASAPGRCTRLALVAVTCAWLCACSGEPQTAGEAASFAVPDAVLAARAAAQQPTPPAFDEAVGSTSPDQILFGDLHVHTTFSSDAFILSLPIMGGSGAHPPADACDFARFCAGLDFYSINDHAEGSSPRLWSETIDSIEQCNAVAGDTENPDMVAFLGWEWTQVGTTPEDHYGHKNVVLREFERGRVPKRSIAAPRGEFRAVLLPTMARLFLPLVQFRDRQRYFDYTAYGEEIAAVPACPRGVPSDKLPEDCYEIADTPRDLYRKLDDWNAEALVIPHGTSWGLMTPPGFEIATELARGQHDPDRQRLFEIYSGHGGAEAHRPTRAAVRDVDGWTCPEPSDDFLPCCWRAGEIIRDRCDDPSSDVCEEEVVVARQRFVDAGVAGNRTVPGAQVEDWQDCDQCRSCAASAYSHRPGGSAQAALAATAITTPGSEPARFRFGLIGSSDTHDARGGNGFKELGRLHNTESPYVTGLALRSIQDSREPVAESVAVRLNELPLSARRYTERGASFLKTGGLVAVHSPSRRRGDIWNALESRRVYGTSGDRILLWFDLLNGPDGVSHSMGAEVVDQAAAPRFRAVARGAFEQRPGCPDYVTEALGEERTDALCLGECYFPSDRRRTITRIEVVRIQAAMDVSEPIAPLIEDPWRTLDCPGTPEGCSVEFEDLDFGRDGRETIYYVRAIQEPTPAVNGGNLRCEYDEQGRCVELTPCFGDDRTDPDDDCLAPLEERAWSSPIFVTPPGS